MDLNKIGKFISSLRKENHLTQQELAEKLFVSDKAVSKWERGLCCPDIETMHNLSKLFHVQIEEIINGQKKNHLRKEDVFLEYGKYLEKKLKQKKRFYFKFIFFLIAIFLFCNFVVYFCVNYNQFTAYLFEGEKDGFHLNGNIIFTKEKTIFNLTNLSYNKELDKVLEGNISLLCEDATIHRHDFASHISTFLSPYGEMYKTDKTKEVFSQILTQSHFSFIDDSQQLFSRKSKNAFLKTCHFEINYKEKGEEKRARIYLNGHKYSNNKIFY